jgi:mono/diheme cytochrome c family protein
MTTRLVRAWGFVWLVAVIASGASGCAPTADTDSPSWRGKEEQAARVAAGQRLFAAYCSSCHGALGLGNGPVAPALRTAPADLTRIAERNGGAFDPARVAAYIDGRTRIEAHGDREMPVWGRMFDDRNENVMGDETLLSPGMIFNVVEYLATIQTVPTPGAK